jgi:hypothetical protein
VLPAAKGSVLTVTLDAPRDPRRRERDGADRHVRRVRWLSAADGSVVRSIDVTAPRWRQVIRLGAIGREVVGLSDFDPRQRTCKMIVLRVRQVGKAR